MGVLRPARKRVVGQSPGSLCVGMLRELSPLPRRLRLSLSLFPAAFKQQLGLPRSTCAPLVSRKSAAVGPEESDSCSAQGPRQDCKISGVSHRADALARTRSYGQGYSLTVLILGPRRLLSRQLDEQSTEGTSQRQDRLLYRDAANTRVVKRSGGRER